jgi:hypothetical protein
VQNDELHIISHDLPVKLIQVVFINSFLPQLVLFNTFLAPSGSTSQINVRTHHHIAKSQSSKHAFVAIHSHLYILVYHLSNYQSVAKSQRVRTHIFTKAKSTNWRLEKIATLNHHRAE